MVRSHSPPSSVLRSAVPGFLRSVLPLVLLVLLAGCDRAHGTREVRSPLPAAATVMAQLDLDLVLDGDTAVAWILGDGALDGCPDFPWFIRKGSSGTGEPLVVTTPVSSRVADRLRRLTGVDRLRTVTGPLPDSMLVARLRLGESDPQVLDARWIAPRAALARPARELRRLDTWLSSPPSDTPPVGPGPRDDV